MTAVRLARGVTGRTAWSSSPATTTATPTPCSPPGAAAWPRSACLARPGSRRRRWPDTLVAPYNVVPELDERRRGGDRRAGRRQHGPGRAGAGFLEGLRAECDRVGALLVFDEVITGFRLGRAGAGGLAVRPDLSVLRQGDRRRAPDRAFGGRRGRHGVALATRPRVPGRHALREPAGDRRRARRPRPARRGAYDQLTTTARRLADGLQDAIAAAGIAVTVPAVGPLVGLRLAASRRPTSTTASRPTPPVRPLLPRPARRRASRSRRAPTRSLFPGLAHDDAVVDVITAEIAFAAAAELATATN